MPLRIRILLMVFMLGLKSLGLTQSTVSQAELKIIEPQLGSPEYNTLFQVRIEEEDRSQYIFDAIRKRKFLIEDDIDKVNEETTALKLSKEEVDLVIKKGIQFSALKFLSIHFCYDPAVINRLLAACKNLEFLALGHNNLQEIPSGVYQLKALKYLSFDSNRLNTIPQKLNLLTKLETLDLSWNKTLTNLDNVHLLKNLQFLKASNCQIETIPPDFSRLKKLTLLDLQLNQIREFPEELTTLSALKYLDLLGNKLSHLPKNIGNLSNLQTLHLSANPLQHLPEEIGHFKDLQQLSVVRCRLADLPSSIGKLSNLKKLFGEENNLQVLPEEIGSLSSLEYLNLGNNQLRDLPLAFNQLHSLKELLLYGNKLIDLKEKLSTLYNLQELSLSSNFKLKLTGIEKLSRLKRLQLNLCGYFTVPTEVCALSELEYLSLIGNNLSALPDEFLNLQKLSQLHLDGNHFQEFPPVLLKCKAIYYLYLNLNKIANLPDDYPYRAGPNLVLTRNPIMRNPEELEKLRNWEEYLCDLPELYFERKSFQQALGKALECWNMFTDNPNKMPPQNLIKYNLYAQKPAKAIELSLAYFKQHNIWLTTSRKEVETQVNAYLIIAYVLNNQFEQAEKLIEDWKGKVFNNQKNANTHVLEEITSLEADGITHPDFQKVKSLLQ